MRLPHASILINIAMLRRSIGRYDSERVGSKVNDLSLSDDTTHTANKFLVHWILSIIVISVFCTLKLNDERMGYTVLERITLMSEESIKHVIFAWA